MRKNRIASRYCRFASRYCRIAGDGVAVADMDVEPRKVRNSRRHVSDFVYFDCFVVFVDIIVHSMLILALDTTTRGGSSALARDGVVLRDEASDPAQAP